MTTIKYEIGKSYALHNGGRAVIGYVFENGNAYAMYSNDTVQDYVCPVVFLPDGRAEHGPRAMDIIPPEPEKREVWIAVQRVDGKLCAASAGNDGCETRGEVLNLWGSPGVRVGCHRITLRAEFEEDA